MNTHTIKGYICADCRLVWVGGFDQQETGIDPDSSTFSAGAEGFAELVDSIDCAEEEDSSNGYYDCLFCNETNIGGFKTVLSMKDN